jgi:phenylacetate-coenzyme A ligase PaaK-like adenylate-forming protein
MMENWSFPAHYDEDYSPAPGERYWFKTRETMPAAERERAILERLQVVCAYAYEKAPFYKTKWDDAGFHPSKLKSLEDFEKIPVVQKKDLREAQARMSPFGDYLCVPDNDVFHIHGTSGTTGRPTAFAIGRNDWRTIANAHARIMWGMGLRPGDTICVAAIFSLYMGSWGALAGAERLGAKCFPFGAGVPGMSARCAQWLDMIKPTAFYGTPTYALHLAQVAQDEGLNPRDFRLKIMFFSGEPGASIPGVRDRIEEIYGAKVFDSGSMAEISPWMNVAGSAQTSGMLCWQDIVYTEVCDPTSFHRVPYGQRGTPVYTHLERTSQPIVALHLGLGLVYFSFVFRMQIGFRFVLMCVPLVAILAAAGLVGQVRHRFFAAGLAVVVLTVLAENAAYLGNSLAFTSAAVQPKREAFRLLADSNIDYGQNREKMEAWFRERKSPTSHLDPVHILPGENILAFNLASGATDFSRHAWLREHLRPNGHFRHTYLFFDVSPDQFEEFLAGARRFGPTPGESDLCPDPPPEAAADLVSGALLSRDSLRDRVQLLCMRASAPADLALRNQEGEVVWGRADSPRGEWDRLRDGREAWYRLDPGTHAFVLAEASGFSGEWLVRGGPVSLAEREMRMNKRRRLRPLPEDE